MAADILLQGEVLWAYDYDLETKSKLSGIAGLFSFMTPLHNHKGVITLTADHIEVSGDEPLNIPLYLIEQLYLGFDDYFPSSSVKNLGAFWQPLRVQYSLTSSQTATVYLVINYNGVFTDNKKWFEVIKNLLLTQYH